MSTETIPSRTQLKNLLLALNRQHEPVADQTLSLSTEKDQALRALKGRAQGVASAVQGLLRLCFKSLGYEQPLMSDHEPSEIRADVTADEVAVVFALYNITRTGHAIASDHYGTYKTALARSLAGEDTGLKQPVIDDAFMAEVKSREEKLDAAAEVYSRLAARQAELQGLDANAARASAIICAACKEMIEGLSSDLKAGNGLGYFDIYSREDIAAHAAEGNATIDSALAEVTDGELDSIAANISDEERQFLDKLGASLASAFSDQDAADMVAEMADVESPGSRAGFLRAFDDELVLTYDVMNCLLFDLMKRLPA